MCPPRVRSAFAKGLSVDKSKVSVDFDSKTVSVDLDGKEADTDALAAALEATNKFSLSN